MIGDSPEIATQGPTDPTAHQQQLQAALEEARHQLHLAHQELQAKTIALREVISTVEARNQEIGQRITGNIEATILPLLDSLGQGLPRAQAEMVREIREGLEEIVSPFVDRLSRRFQTLSPAEVRMCSLIRRGLDNKTIARITNLSVQTVATHRRNIRRKLGIARSKLNMSAYLQSVASDDGHQPL